MNLARQRPRSTRPHGGWRLVLGMVLAWLCRAAGGQEDGFQAGPLFDKFSLTLSYGQRTEIAGPFYYRSKDDAEATWALPPLLSWTHYPDTDAEEFNVAYPVMSYIRYGQQYRWQLFQLLSVAGGPTAEETARDRFTLFPVYFRQRSSDSNENYCAYGPFYGHLKNRLFRDEIRYVMFPGYSETRKGDVVTDNYFYPFYHQRYGPGLQGWQLWPFYGQEHKDVTTRTNGFGDVETVPGHDKQFALWPVYFNAYTGLGTTNPAHQYGAIPLFSLERSPQRDATTVGWPFFSHVRDRGSKYWEWDLPWPLVEFARGTGKHTSRVWPFYSHAYSSNVVSDFYLWPIYKFNGINAAPLERRRHRIAFFLYSDATDKDTDSGASRRHIEQWPFFTWHRDLKGNQRLQILAILEPFVPENPNIEHEYAPVYSVWRAEKNRQTGATSQSLLWNLYRHDAAPAAHRWSALFGLFQCRTDAVGRHWRLFYIPLGATPPPARKAP